MKIFFLRTIVLLFLVFLQLSFFDVLFPGFRAPLFLLGVIVILSLVRGFPSALYMTVPLTLLFDAASVGAVTWFSLYAVIFAYGTSFLSRRLLIEHRGLGLGLYATVSYLGVLLYQGIFWFLIHEEFVGQSLSHFTFLPSLESLVFSFLTSLPLFIVTYLGIERFERSLELMSQKQFLNVR